MQKYPTLYSFIFLKHCLFQGINSQLFKFTKKKKICDFMLLTHIYAGFHLIALNKDKFIASCVMLF